MVIVCIGTPKILGDSVAPLVGDELIRRNINAYVYGTSTSPITSDNYYKFYDHIMEKHKGEPVIAIDSALGKTSGIGQVSIVKDGVAPGCALAKNYAKIGVLGILAQVGSSEIRPDIALKIPSSDLILKLIDKCVNIVVNILDIAELNKYGKTG